jgi:Ca2+-binding protein (EF-Hand superfamily)
VDSNSKIGLEDFEIILKSLDIKILKSNIHQLFNYFDKNQDGYIDLKEWIEGLTQESIFLIINFIVRISNKIPLYIYEEIWIEHKRAPYKNGNR